MKCSDPERNAPVCCSVLLVSCRNICSLKQTSAAPAPSRGDFPGGTEKEPADLEGLSLGFSQAFKEPELWQSK